MALPVEVTPQSCEPAETLATVVVNIFVNHYYFRYEHMYLWYA